MNMTTSQLVHRARATMKRPTTFSREKAVGMAKIHVFTATESGLIVALDRTNAAKPTAALSFNDARARHFCAVDVTSITEPPPGRGNIERLTRPFPAAVTLRLPPAMVDGGGTLELARTSPDPDMGRLDLSGRLPVETVLCPYADHLRYRATLRIGEDTVEFDDVFPLTEAGARYFLGTSVLYTAGRPTAADMRLVQLADEYLAADEMGVAGADIIERNACYTTLRLAYMSLQDAILSKPEYNEPYLAIGAEAYLRALLYGGATRRDYYLLSVLGDIRLVSAAFAMAGLPEVGEAEIKALFEQVASDPPCGDKHG